MRLAAVLVAAMVTISPLQAAASGKTTRARAAADPAHSDMVKMLTAPAEGDSFYVRNAVHARDRTIGSGMFGALQKVLGGDEPTLNFPTQVDPNGQFHSSATVAQNQVNLDPVLAAALAVDENPFHSGAVNTVPHEMAHLRQIASVLANLHDREGGAQAFADTVSPIAAAAARTSYDAGRNYDGPYYQYVQDVLAKNGRDWIFGGQFGKPPVAWP